MTLNIGGWRSPQKWKRSARCREASLKLHVHIRDTIRSGHGFKTRRTHRPCNRCESGHRQCGCAPAGKGTSEQVPRGARYDPNAMDARSAVQPIAILWASRATQQTRVWVVTRRDGDAVGAFRRRNLLQYSNIAASLLLELHPTAPPSRPRGTCSEIP